LTLIRRGRLQMTDLDDALREAVKLFWRTRRRQREDQGAEDGQKDRGGGAAVTGGSQMDGFVRLVNDLLVDRGIEDADVYHQRKRGGVVLPGFFRPTKQWDLLVVVRGKLLATLEFKSQVGPSFGNNFNNRVEEAVGSSTDLWTAYREGAFGQWPRPWLGYLMLLEEAPGSTRPVGVAEPHFGVFDEFRDASYAERYRLLGKRLVREGLYDAACLILSDAEKGPDGAYREPCDELTFRRFGASLGARAREYAEVIAEEEAE